MPGQLALNLPQQRSTALYAKYTEGERILSAFALNATIMGIGR